MRKSLLKVLNAALFVGISASFSFSADLPDNYNSLKWKTDITKIQGFKFAKNSDGFKVYIKDGDSMKVEGKTATSVKYYTNNNLLSSVEVTFNKMSCDSLYEKAVNKYGKSKDVSQNETPVGTISVAKWSNKTTMFSLSDFATNATGATRKKFPNWCVWSIGVADR